jgi:hypothetical protein
MDYLEIKEETNGEFKALGRDMQLEPMREWTKLADLEREGIVNLFDLCLGLGEQDIEELGATHVVMGTVGGKPWLAALLTINESIKTLTLELIATPGNDEFTALGSDTHYLPASSRTLSSKERGNNTGDTGKEEEEEGEEG